MSKPHDSAAETVWPSPEYLEQIQLLKTAVGQKIYLAEVRQSEINLSVTLDSQPFELLDVIDFPRPDPARNLMPHVLLLDDGRGINLGRVARVSLKRSFQPAATDIVYQDRQLLDDLLYCERRLSQDRVKAISKQHLGALLGRPEPELLEQGSDDD